MCLLGFGGGTGPVFDLVLGNVVVPRSPTLGLGEKWIHTVLPPRSSFVVLAVTRVDLGVDNPGAIPWQI